MQVPSSNPSTPSSTTADESDDSTDSPDRDADTDRSDAPDSESITDRESTQAVAAASVGTAGATTIRVSGLATALRNLFTASFSQSVSALLGQFISAVFARLAWIVGATRHSSRDPLAHETRAELYAMIDDEPGCFLSEISEQLEIPLSTVRYHLRVLTAERLVTVEKTGGKRRYYPLDTSDPTLLGALAEDSTAVFIRTLADQPSGLSVSELAGKIDRDPSTVSHHLSRLEDAGLVVRERDGRAVVSRLSERARTALDAEDLISNSAV